MTYHTRPRSRGSSALCGLYRSVFANTVAAFRPRQIANTVSKAVDILATSIRGDQVSTQTFALAVCSKVAAQAEVCGRHVRTRLRVHAPPETASSTLPARSSLRSQAQLHTSPNQSAASIQPVFQPVETNFPTPYVTITPAEETLHTNRLPQLTDHPQRWHAPGSVRSASVWQPTRPPSTVPSTAGAKPRKGPTDNLLR